METNCFLLFFHVGFICFWQGEIRRNTVRRCPQRCAVRARNNAIAIRARHSGLNNLCLLFALIKFQTVLLGGLGEGIETLTRPLTKSFFVMDINESRIKLFPSRRATRFHRRALRRYAHISLLHGAKTDRLFCYGKRRTTCTRCNERNRPIKYRPHGKPRISIRHGAKTDRLFCYGKRRTTKLTRT